MQASHLCFYLAIFFAVSSNAQIFIPYSYWACKTEGFEYEITNTAEEFAKGTFSNTTASGNSVVLSVGQTTGTYTSKVYDVFGGCSPLQSWRKFEWQTPLPYGKEIPVSSETATDYSGITAGLTTNLQLLFHMNGSGNIANNATIPGSVAVSGTANNSNGSGMSYVSAGKIASAVSMDGTDDAITMAYTQTNVNDYTVAAWIKTTTTGNGVILQNRGTGAGRSLTLGIGTNPGGCGTGRISYGVDSDTVYIGKCSTSTYHNGAWRHVVGVWDGTSGTAVASSQFTIYVDGAAVATSDVSTGTAPTPPISGLSNTKIGRHDAWAVNYAGQVDELAVWSRPLSATEVQQLYRRGGNNIRFQIKTCDTSTCGDVATWKGPDNTNATFFTELNNNSDQNTFLGAVQTTFPSMFFSNFPSLVVDTKRYFQYQATLSSDNTALQPEFSYAAVHHGCAAGTVNYSTSGSFLLPALCTQMTVTLKGAGGASARSVGGGNRVAGGTGGSITKTFTGQTPLTVYEYTLGTGGDCTGAAGGGAFAAGAGSTSGDGSGGAGATGFGGAGGIGSSNDGGAGGHGGGGGGFGGASTDGGGGGGASSFKMQGAGSDLLVAGGGGGSGGVQTGTAGGGGGACSGAASGDYTRGSNGLNGTGGNRAGGGGGGACYCPGGGCSAIGATGGAGGDVTGGNACNGGTNNGNVGTISITYQ